MKWNSIVFAEFLLYNSCEFNNIRFYMIFQQWWRMLRKSIWKSWNFFLILTFANLWGFKSYILVKQSKSITVFIRKILMNRQFDVAGSKMINIPYFWVFFSINFSNISHEIQKWRNEIKLNWSFEILNSCNVKFQSICREKGLLPYCLSACTALRYSLYITLRGGKILLSRFKLEELVFNQVERIRITIWILDNF